MPIPNERTVIRVNPGSVESPRWKFEAVISQDGVVVADYTGSNALYFPDVLAALSTADQDEIMDSIANTVMYRRAGLGA